MKLTEIYKENQRLLTAEFLPPKTHSLRNLGNKTLKVAEAVDAVCIPELKADAIHRHRMSPFYTALRLREITGVETVFHLTPRDCNRNALAGTLLAAINANLQNILVIAGDRYSAEEQRLVSRNVYDYRGPIGLIKGIRSLELDVGRTGFCIVIGTDPTVFYASKGDIQKEISTLVARQEAGADMVQTQPVFDISFLEFLDLAKEHGLKIPVVPGILPLYSLDDSLSIAQRYGIRVPEEMKEALRHPSEPNPRQLSLDLISKLVKNGVRAFHIYPRGNCDFVLDVAKLAFKRGE